MPNPELFSFQKWCTPLFTVDLYDFFDDVNFRSSNTDSPLPRTRDYAGEPSGGQVILVSETRIFWCSLRIYSHI